MQLVLFAIHMIFNKDKKRNQNVTFKMYNPRYFSIAEGGYHRT